MDQEIMDHSQQGIAGEVDHTKEAQHNPVQISGHPLVRPMAQLGTTRPSQTMPTAGEEVQTERPVTKNAKPNEMHNHE